MTRIKISPTSPTATTSRRSGFVVSDTNNGAIASKWPRPRGAATEGYDYYRQQEFGLAAKWASDPIPEELATAHALTRGTQYVPRDMIMKASFGTLYEITLSDGTTLIAERIVDPNAQLILDQITTQQGSLIYRGPQGWIALKPANDGDVVMQVGGVPTYQPVGSSGNIGVTQLPFTTGATTAGGVLTPNAASLGTVFVPRVPITLTAIGAVYTAVLNAVYRCGIATFNTTTRHITANMTWTNSHTALAAGGSYGPMMILPSPLSLTPATTYLIVLNRTDATAATPLQCNTIGAFYPSPAGAFGFSNGALQLASLNPTTSDTWTVTAQIWWQVMLSGVFTS